MNKINHSEQFRGTLAPLLLNESTAAALLDESEQTRRLRRYEDEKRLKQGDPIHGPAWVRDGKRVKYRLADIRSYADRIPNCTGAGSDASEAA